MKAMTSPLVVLAFLFGICGLAISITALNDAEGQKVETARDAATHFCRNRGASEGAMFSYNDEDRALTSITIDCL